jgi:rhodanese-related sulfurtransferase
MRAFPALLLSLALGACGAPSGPGTNLSPAKADSLIQANKSDSSFLLLDVRTPEEYAMGHIDRSRLVDFHAADFQTRITALPRQAPILLYCRSGNRSGQALKMMQDLGFTNVRHLAGGINLWQAEARPLVR